ncbi:hypothetical protein [Actinoplanes sp. NPDC020271]|uniref:hypothetical protein n=1 Tax=Actinoplanes sp. NPDC020271 TaxID=3363896 RepID=UPI0037BAEFB9
MTMAGWAVFLALHAPQVTFSVGSARKVQSIYDCDRPLAYAFTKDLSDAAARAGGDQYQRQADAACRDTAIGSAVTISLLGVGIALLLGFTRPLALTPRTAPTNKTPW